MLKNVASQKWIVFAYDSTTGLAKTGDAGNITANIRIDGGAAGAVGDTNPTELEDGYYVFDMTQAETNGNLLLLCPASGTADIIVIGVPGAVWTRDATTVQMGVNLVNIAGVAVSVTTAQLGVNVVQVSADATAADNLEAAYDGTGYAGGTIKQKVDVDTIKTQTVTCNAGVTIGAYVGNATAAISVDASGRLDIIKIAGMTQTARDIGTSVLLSSGTGTGQLNFTSGVVSANMTQYNGATAHTGTTSGLIPAELHQILGQSVTCAAGVTFGAYVGNAGALQYTDANGRVDIIKIAGTTQTARDIGLSVLLSSGTGTGQISFTSGIVSANITQYNGTTAHTGTTSGLIPAELHQVLGQSVTCAAGVTFGAYVGNAGALQYTDANGRVDIIKMAGTTLTARDIGTSVLLSSGTGTGQLDFTSGVVKSNMVQILAAAITGTAAQIVAAFTKWFNVSSPTGTVNSIPDAVAGATNGLQICGTCAATTYASLTVTNALTTGSIVNSGVFTQTGTMTLNALTVTNNLLVSGTTTLTGNVTLSGTLGVGATTLSALTVTNNLLISGTTTHTGAVTLTAGINAGAISGTLANNFITAVSIKADAIDAIHDEVVEGSLTFRQITRLALAVLAGESAGGGTATITFRDNADSKNRISATVDVDGNRTAVTLDAT